MTPGPRSSSSTWVEPGATLKLSQLLSSLRSPRGSPRGLSFCSPLRRISPTRIVEVERMDRPSCGLARSSNTPALAVIAPSNHATSTRPAIFDMALAMASLFTLRGFEPELFNLQASTLRFIERFSIPNAYRPIAVRSAKKRVEITGDRRFEIQDLIHGIVTGSGKAEDQRIRGHCPRIPVAALVFVERIPDPAVIPIPARAHHIQTFVDQAQPHHVRSNLVLDPGPNLVGIDKGKRQLAAFGPGAQKQSAFFATRVGRSLRIGEIRQVMFQVIAMQGP